MGVSILYEYRFEVRAARRQDSLVRLEGLSVTSQRHIAEGLPPQKTAQDICQVRGVVVPTQAELLIHLRLSACIKRNISAGE